MTLSRTVGLAVAVSLVAGILAALAQISGAAPADPTADVGLRIPGGDRRLPEDGALPGRRRSGERGLRDLDERDDHRHSKPRRQAQGLVRHGKRQHGNAPRQPVVGRRVGMVVVRRRQAAQDHLDRLPYRLPGVPRARQDHGLDLRKRISRPASLGGRKRGRSTLATAFRRSGGEPREPIRAAGRLKGLL